MQGQGYFVASACALSPATSPAAGCCRVHWPQPAAVAAHCIPFLLAQLMERLVVLACPHPSAYRDPDLCDQEQMSRSAITCLDCDDAVGGEGRLPFLTWRRWRYRITPRVTHPAGKPMFSSFRRWALAAPG